jgi:hypothetical protein
MGDPLFTESRAKKSAHQRRNHSNVLVQGEVASVQEMNLGVGNFASECQSARDRKQGIVFAPRD